MQIIVYYWQNGVLYNTRGNKYTNLWLEALLSESNQDTIQCFYNLDYAVACICKQIGLTEAEIRKIWINPDVNNPEDRPEQHGRVVKMLSCDDSKDYDSVIPYELNYYPKTMFTVDCGTGQGHPFCILSDMTQYMNAKIEPNLGDGVIYSRLNVAKDIAQQVYDALIKLNLKVKTLTSPIRAYQNTVMPSLNLPSWKDMPDGINNYWYQACTGGWVEVYKVGHWDKLYDFDVRACYPYQMRKLPDIKQGAWEKVTTVPNHVNGCCGIFQCLFEPSTDFHPVIFKDEQGRNFTPSGEFPVFLTWNKLDFIKYWKLGEVRIIDGYVWNPTTEKYRRPLLKPMEDLYKLRTEATGINKEVIKRVMVGVYGLLGQTLKYDANIPFGPYFNPCWRAEVENNTHLRVMNFCLENKIVPISITTDGILTDKDLNIIPSKEMGEWKLDSVTKGLVMGSGCIALQGKQKEGDFSLNYDNLVEQIKQFPSITEITIEKEGFISIGEAVERNLFDRLGEFEVDKRSILLNNEIKRMYPIEPKNFGELLVNQYDSIPVDVSMIGGE